MSNDIHKAGKKNLHVPLPEPLYRQLRTEAKRARRPATELAREAIRHWLAERQRELLHDAIRTYAAEVAGTRDDLDRELEAAGIEHLRASDDEGDLKK